MKKGKRVFEVAVVVAVIAVVFVQLARFVEYLTNVIEGEHIVAGRCYHDAEN